MGAYVPSLSGTRRWIALLSFYSILALLALGAVAMAVFVCLDSPWGAKPIDAALNAGAGIAIAGIVVGVCAYAGFAVASQK
jgi:hypothetical protein